MLAFGTLQLIWAAVVFSGMVSLPVIVLLAVIVLPPWPSGWLFRWLGIRPLSFWQRYRRWLLGGACVWAATSGFTGLLMAGDYYLVDVFPWLQRRGYAGPELSILPIALFAAGHAVLGFVFFLSAPRPAPARYGKFVCLLRMTVVLVPVLLVMGLYVGVAGCYVRAIENEDKLNYAPICKTHIGDMWTGISLYRSRNNIPPPDLQTLVETKTLAENTLWCPAGDPSRDRHYFYFPPSAALDAPVGALVLCELEANHAGQKRHVLYNTKDQPDIRALGPEEFAAELAKPVNAAFAATFRAAGGKD